MIIHPFTSKLDTWVLENYEDTEHVFTVRAEIENQSSTQLEIYDDGFGDWYLFGGYCMHFALIRAFSFGDAYDIYLEEFAGAPEEPDDCSCHIEPKNDCDCNYGTFTSNGKWFSEATTSYVMGLDINNYKITVELIPSPFTYVVRGAYGQNHGEYITLDNALKRAYKLSEEMKKTFRVVKVSDYIGYHGYPWGDQLTVAVFEHEQ